MKLYHFSETGNIEVFVPRAPLRHPRAEPLVYAMSEENSPLYLFPRDCPRISTWVSEDTSDADCEEFYARGLERIKSFIDGSFEAAWRTGHVYRYSMDPEGFEDCQGYGDWVSREVQHPFGVELISNLPEAAKEHGMSVEIVDSLVELGQQLHDFEKKQWTTTLHVSMVRMSLLPGWDHATNKPAWTGG